MIERDTLLHEPESPGTFISVREWRSANRYIFESPESFEHFVKDVEKAIEPAKLAFVDGTGDLDKDLGRHHASNRMVRRSVSLVSSSPWPTIEIQLSTDEWQIIEAGQNARAFIHVAMKTTDTHQAQAMLTSAINALDTYATKRKPAKLFERRSELIRPMDRKTQEFEKFKFWITVRTTAISAGVSILVAFIGVFGRLLFPSGL
ncbi:hypothetical protein [Arthrobacter woluwensis]|uniref:hypothetical protein n=1 Tax=Arthrobacter woluwensis TaxID=156980 RepID=UPI001AAF9B7E|nr:hypothetical protein [Arthrobacter woluwensis]QTF71261.1 hypothetical protein G8758_03995 [Arthrobacter woluwensis]